MKKIVLVAFAVLSINALAQPVILNGNNIPVFGTTAPLFSGVAAGIGNPGANQVWDFSGVTFSATPVTWTVVSPDSTPYFSSFPTANYAWAFTSTSPTRYFYFNVSSTKFDVLADNLLTPGSGNDFTPNYKTALQFPFSHGNTFQDTYQKVGGSPGIVTMTYDGYGTLITPFATYTNVWRVKEDLGSGYGTYTWENENPMQPILVYTISNNSFTLFGNAPLSGINDHSRVQMPIDVHPNPTNGIFTIGSKGKNYEVVIVNVLGEKVYGSEIRNQRSEIDLSFQPKGIYFYQLRDEQGVLKTGKIIVE